jgi:glutathione synthase/RimK-type ligase-like ATP-grasp enzyme
MNTQETAVKAIIKLGLDFGAVDIIQTPDGHGWVLEVNTAPAIEGSTVDAYADAFAELFL